jgi:hypothetical protein
MTDISKPKMNFDDEIILLDIIYSEMIEALHNKPDENDVEAMRLFFDNVWGVFNRTIFRVTEIKNNLQADQKLIHETWNPPA